MSFFSSSSPALLFHFKCVMPFVCHRFQLVSNCCPITIFVTCQFCDEKSLRGERTVLSYTNSVEAMPKTPICGDLKLKCSLVRFSHILDIGERNRPATGAGAVNFQIHIYWDLFNFIYNRIYQFLCCDCICRWQTHHEPQPPSTLMIHCATCFKLAFPIRALQPKKQMYWSFGTNWR